MSNIIPFQFDDLNVRVVADESGEPWFVASDVCAALALENTTKALLRLDEDEQALISIQGISRGNDQVNPINESGLYSLILGSRKPEAKRFKKWVTSEVLPSIRKTGAYSAQPVPPQHKARAKAAPHAMREQVASLLMIGKALTKVKGVNEALATACTLEAIERTTGLPSTLLARALPTVAPNDAATLNATQVGEPLGLSGRATNALLETMGLQYRDEAKNWKLTEAGTAYGEMKPFHKNGHSGYETHWKPAVVEVARKHQDGLQRAA